MCQCLCDTHVQPMTEMNLRPCLDRLVRESSSEAYGWFLLFQVEPQTVAEVRRRRRPPAPTAASCPASDVPVELNSIETSFHTQLRCFL